MAPHQPPSLRVWVSTQSGEHTTTCDMKQGNQVLKLQLSALAEAVCKGLTYISRMLPLLLSLSMEGINPHEGERHIQALVTG